MTDIKKLLHHAARWIPRITVFFILGITLCCIVQLLQGSPIPMLFGWGTATVKTGSMVPSLPVGSLVFIQDTEHYGVGDMITYADADGNAITHRIVSISEGVVVTKGDANNAEDRPFSEQQIIGQVRFMIPGIGAFLMKMKTPTIIAILILAILLLYVFPLIPKRKEKVKYEQTDF